MNITDRIARLATVLATAILCTTATVQLTGCTDNNAGEQVVDSATTDAAQMAEAVAANVAGKKINLNTATKEDFLTVPGVGDRMVREFMEYRPYKSIGQFRREIGKYVDEAQVAEYEKFLFVPVDPNNSDDETIMQLPGVDQSVIDELNLVKPFGSMDDFVTAVSEFITPEQLQEGLAYLVEE